ncbi:MAG: asparaginase domain-containing protein [Sphingobium sp.]
MASSQETILILTTGGTIDKQYFDALSQYQVGETMIAHLLKIARVAHPVEIEEICRKDSLELDDRDRARIAERVRNTDASRIVITHGTDTMTDTAAVLAGIEGKTVALVGALAPARFAESDAMFNLGMAIACVQAAPPGIYITMNGSVFRGDAVRKDREKGCFVSTDTSSS